jgi:hypothetical protein
MNRFRFVAFALAALVPALQAGAQDAIQDLSPSADIQPVAPLSQTVATGAVLEHPFAVRIVDRSGHPIAGAGVAFFVNTVGPGPGQVDPNPPAGTYGSFAALPAGTNVVRTSADGVAAGPVFLFLIFNLIASQAERARDLKLPIVGAIYAPAIVSYLERQQVTVMEAPADYDAQIRRGDLDVVLVVDEAFAADVAQGKPGGVRLVFDRSRDRARPPLTHGIHQPPASP